jgi:tetrahydromethanopterin S-methyltransferase subunit B
MARALLGYVGNGNEQVLVLEVARLRRRVAELEAQVAELREATHTEIDLELQELHRIAEAAEPALA